MEKHSDVESSDTEVELYEEVVDRPQFSLQSLSLSASTSDDRNFQFVFQEPILNSVEMETSLASTLRPALRTQLAEHAKEPQTEVVQTRDHKVQN